MTQPLWFPEVRAVVHDSGDRAQISLAVPAELDCFRGHFPGLPILPGVVLLDWAVKLPAMHLSSFGAPRGAARFRSMENVKFLKAVVPGTVLDLTLGWSAQRRQLAFGYSIGETPVAAGRLNWSDAA